MSRSQIAEAKKLIGKMPREEIAEKIGCSVPALKRAFRGTRLAYFNKYVINPGLVKAVCEYYEKHGRAETQKRFPGVRFRSIVERYKLYAPRQVRWTDREIVEAARMAGLLSEKEMADFFDRPNAREGSIKSLFMKRFGFGGGGIHGMSGWMARHLVHEQCPYLVTRFWATRRGEAEFGRRLYLWCDMERHLKPGLPEFIGEAIETLAEFQCWLFRTPNPKRAIVRMLKARSSPHVL